MQAVLEGFTTIGAVITLGALVAHLGLVDLAAQRILTTIAFFVATPALMVTMLSRADVRQVLSANLLASAAAVLVVVVVYTVINRVWWRHPVGDSVIGMMAGGYVNAGNLGVPIAAYVLGDAAYVAPTLLMQLLVLQPIALAVLDHHSSTAARTGMADFVRRAASNPLTIGSVLGVALSLGGWTLPRVVHDPLALVGNMAVPMVLLAYGVALRLGPRFGEGSSVAEVGTLTVLKLVVQPVAAWAVASGLGLRGHALLAVVVTSALPTAQNIFVHATRYRRQETLARDTILLSTLASVPVILVATLLLA